MPLTVQVVTPEREVEVAADASMVLAHGVEGDVGILPGHAPLLIALGTGPLEIVRPDRRDAMLVDGGFLQVKDDRVIVLAEYAVLPGEIDPAAAAREVEVLRREAEAAPGDDAARGRLARAEATLKLAGR
ncbi:MAG: ATP synthase F1 subunit epsilon [Acidobacteria bacterium]|nr:ATP synthase F1 subunit epsilon [Acidobacteriota bacterium]